MAYSGGYNTQVILRFNRTFAHRFFAAFAVAALPAPTRVSVNRISSTAIAASKRLGLKW